MHLRVTGGTGVEVASAAPVACGPLTETLVAYVTTDVSMRSFEKAQFMPVSALQRVALHKTYD